MIKRSILLACTIATGAAVNAAPAPVVDVNSDSLTQRVEALERVVESRTTAQHRIQGQLDELQQEVNTLRGNIEEHNYQLEKILQRQRELYLEIDKRFEAAKALTSGQPQAGMPGLDSEMTPSVPVATTPTSGTSSNVSDSVAYEQAVNLIIKEKKYDEAIPAFKDFLSSYPASSYAPNAHYWLGQLLFNKQDWAGAGEQFNKVVTDFSDSNKRADSMLKLAQVEQKRSNLAKAKQLFEAVIAEYPNSSSSSMAQNYLKSM